jgi:multimeric flavodoxin WrbA
VAVAAEKVVATDILIIATPTWLGQPSSIAKRVLERMDALLSETKEDGRPIADDKLAGVVVTGNQDGAHHYIAEVSGALIDLGYTIAGQGWTYWNKGPGPGEEEYLSSDETEWSNTTGKTTDRTRSPSPRRSPRTRSPRPPAESRHESRCGGATSVPTTR